MSELPQNWCIAPLGEIASITSGIGFPKRYQGKISGEFGFFKVGDISRAVLEQSGQLRNPEHYVSAEVAIELKGKPIPPGTTVFAKIGEAIKLNRRAYTVHECLIDNNVMAIKSLITESDRYLYMFLRTQDFTELSRATTVPSLRKKDIEHILVPLAPLSEQRRITDKLDEVLTRVDACRERLDRVPAIIKRFRQAVLAAATSGALTEDWRQVNNLALLNESSQTSEVAEPYRHRISAPGSWLSMKLGDVCDFIGGSQPPKATFVHEPGPGLIRLIQIRDYKSDKHITFIPESLAKRFCSKTDIMIGRYGPPLFQILRGLEGAYNVALMKAQPKNENIDLEYLYVFLRNDQLLKYVEAGSDRTAGQDGVRKELLNPYPIFLPSLGEQHEIVRRVESLFAYADKLESRYTTAREQVERLTPALLAKAFRGELVPQDIDDEPASVLLERIKAARAVDEAKLKQRKKVRKAPMKKLTPDDVQSIIQQMPVKEFSFDDLRNQVSSDYETLKEVVFALLADSSSGLKQVFDTQTGSMRFVRENK